MGHWRSPDELWVLNPQWHTNAAGGFITARYIFNSTHISNKTSQNEGNCDCGPDCPLLNERLNTRVQEKMN